MVSMIIYVTYMVPPALARIVRSDERESVFGDLLLQSWPIDAVSCIQPIQKQYSRSDMSSSALDIYSLIECGLTHPAEPIIT